MRKTTKKALGLLCIGISFQQVDSFVGLHHGVSSQLTRSFHLNQQKEGCQNENLQSIQSRHHRRPRNNYKRQRDRTRGDHNPLNSNRWGLSQERRTWLLHTTKDLLESEHGSLTAGKWHELISMLRAWHRYRKSEAESPVLIEQILKRLLEERKAGNEEVRVDIEMYNQLLDAWCCAALFRTRKPSVASQRAREILVMLQETFELEQDIFLRPNGASFEMVFHAVCRTEGPTIARRVLAWMEYIYRVKRNILAKPSRKQYVMLLDAYAHSKGENTGLLTEGFIRHMKITGVEPDTFCYNVALKAWTRSKRGRELAEHADRILEGMDAPKDLVTYSTAIAAWGASGMRSHAVARAEELLRDIEENSNLEPNTVVLNTVMSTWVKSRNPAAVNRTGELLEYMENSDSCMPDLISYNTHLHALSLHGNRKKNAHQANELLIDLEQRANAREIPFKPNLFSYNLVIDAWCKSEDAEAAWNAVKVLRMLLRDDRPDPDTFSFNQVFNALSYNSRPGAAQLAEKLLHYMTDAYRLGIHKRCKPDVVGYTSVICALARSGEEDAAERAERLFKQMKEAYREGERNLKPTRLTFNALIDCWARSGKGTYAARKAEALLQEMESMCSLGDNSLSPNIITYNSVLNSWAKSGTRCGANKAEEYLERMWASYNAGEATMAPDDTSFNTVINAISKSPDKAKAQKALRILRRMDKLYQAGYRGARPNEVTYTCVLNSCAFPASMDQKTKRKAFATAIFTLNELQASRYGHPNDVTYATFFQACANLLSEDDAMLRAVLGEAFQQCCRDGQVGEMVLSHLRDAAPEDLYNEFFAEILHSEEAINFDDIPPEWRRNVLKYKIGKRGRLNGKK